MVEPHRPAGRTRQRPAARHLGSLGPAEWVLRNDPSRLPRWRESRERTPRHLDETQRATIAQSVLGTLGFETPGAVGQAERQRLMQYEAAQRHEAAQMQQRLQVAEQTIASFSQGREHFPTVRLTMAALMQSGDANDLADAYRKACQLRGLTPSAEAAAAAAAQAQRAVEKAKTARTPRTSSVPVPAEDDEGDASQRDLLRAEFRRAQTANNRR